MIFLRTRNRSSRLPHVMMNMSAAGEPNLLNGPKSSKLFTGVYFVNLNDKEISDELISDLIYVYDWHSAT